MLGDKWLDDLEQREIAFISNPPKDTVERRNTLILQLLSDRLTKRCANKFCEWPIQALREQNFSVPFIGEVCATCHDMYTAISIMNPFLKMGRHFHNAHDEWANEAAAEKRKRRDMGLE